MTDRELDAAGITDPGLRAAYLQCRRLNARHGKTYFLATRLLPVARRRRRARPVRVRALGRRHRRRPRQRRDHRGTRPAPSPPCSSGWSPGLHRGDSAEPVVQGAGPHRTPCTASTTATSRTSWRRCAATWTVTDYPTFEDLRALHARVGRGDRPPDAAGARHRRPAARKRRRTPPPSVSPSSSPTSCGTSAKTSTAAGSTCPRICSPPTASTANCCTWSRATGARDRRITAALEAAADLTRGVYREAAPGLAILDPVSRPCIRTAFVLYGGILDAVRDDGYAVLHRRAAVPRRRRIAVALDGLTRVAAARLRAAGFPGRPRRTGCPLPGASTRRRHERRGPHVAAASSPAAASPSRSVGAAAAHLADAKPGLIAAALKRAHGPSFRELVRGLRRARHHAGPSLRPYRRRHEVVPGVTREGGWSRDRGPARTWARRSRTAGCAAAPSSATGTDSPWTARRSRAGSPSRRTTTASWPGCAWTRRGRRSPWNGRSSPSVRTPQEPSPRSAPAPASANRRTWSPTGSIPGTERGSTRTRSSISAWWTCPPRARAGTASSLDVSFKVAGRAVVPVRAVFTTPEPRTVVMHITEGEGRGSVVETHATPLGPDGRGRPRTAVIEAVVASSDRPGFAVARAAAPVLRPLMRAVAGRLWRDDLAYAERRWALRSSGRFPG